MSTNYGYRLYQLGARTERKHSDRHWVSEIKLDDLEELARMLKGEVACGRPTLTESCLLSAGQRPPGHQPAWQIADVVRVGNRLDVRLQYGRVGDFEFGLNLAGGEHPQLVDVAPARMYRVTIYEPTAGTSAVVICETKGRTSGMAELLFKYLTSEGCSLGAPKWVTWRPTPLSDTHRLAALVKDGSAASITLTRKGATSVGKRGAGDLVLQKFGVAIKDGSTLGEMLLKVAGLNTPTARAAEFAKTLQALLPEKAAVGAMGFNDGEVVFEENGKPTTVTPANLDDLWIYPLGTDYPSDNDLIRHGVRRLVPIVAAAKIPVDFGTDGEDG